MKIKIVAHSKGAKEDSLLYNYNKELGPIIIEHNKLAIAKAYNKQLNLALEEELDCLILCHDDIAIHSNVTQQLKHFITEYDVVGVAGASCIHVQKPITWRYLAKHAKDHGKTTIHCEHGAVAHGDPDYKLMSSYGYYPSPALIIDGQFMALSKQAIQTIRFDENCPSRFDFYDLDYCLQAVTNQLKVGVSDICITHQSTGSYSNPDYPKGEEWFFQKWKDIF